MKLTGRRKNLTHSQSQPYCRTASGYCLICQHWPVGETHPEHSVESFSGWFQVQSKSVYLTSDACRGYGVGERQAVCAPTPCYRTGLTLMHIWMEYLIRQYCYPDWYSFYFHSLNAFVGYKWDILVTTKPGNFAFGTWRLRLEWFDFRPDGQMIWQHLINWATKNSRNEQKVGSVCNTYFNKQNKNSC